MPSAAEFQFPIERWGGYATAAICALPTWPLALCADTPVYEDKTNLLFYLDNRGRKHTVNSPADWAKRVAHIKANMQKAMGPLPAPAAAPPDLRVNEEVRLNKYTRRRITFLSEPGDHVPAYLLTPQERTGRLPALLCLPASSEAGKQPPAGLEDSKDLAHAHELAERGYVTIAVDYPLLHHHDTRPTLTIGHSFGGHNALFLAVFDPRVRVIVSSCGFNVLAKHHGGDITAWSRRYYMPWIENRYANDPAKVPFDFTEVLGALSPRPIFINALGPRKSWVKTTARRR